METLKNVNQADVARIVAIRDMKCETIDCHPKKHHRYKSSGFELFQGGELNLDNMPYGYNYATGYTLLR